LVGIGTTNILITTNILVKYGLFIAELVEHNYIWNIDLDQVK